MNYVSCVDVHTALWLLYELSRIIELPTFGPIVSVMPPDHCLQKNVPEKNKWRIRYKTAICVGTYLFTSSFRRFTMYPQCEMTAPGVFNCNIFGLYESNIFGFAVKNCPHNASLFRQSFETTTCSAATFVRSA